jgi:hypothetical protein
LRTCDSIPKPSVSSRTFAIRLSALGDYFAVPGGIPESASVWIRELAKLLPEPTPTFAPSA